MFYVLNVSEARSSVLNLDGFHLAREAKALIRHQVEGGFSRSDYVVASLSDDGFRFGDDDGCTWEPDRGPHTAQAWEAFCRRVGYFPDVEAPNVWNAVDGLRAAESFLVGFEDDPAQDQSALRAVRAGLESLGVDPAGKATPDPVAEALDLLAEFLDNDPHSGAQHDAAVATLAAARAKLGA